VSFPAYPSYRDSGLEWIGTVPSSWTVQPLKTIASFTNGEAFKPSEWSDRGTPIVRIQNLNGSDEFNHYQGSVDPRYHVRAGDLLFGWSGNRGTSFGPFKWARDELHYLNQHIFKIESKNQHTGWLYWCLKAVTEYVEQQAHGIIGMVHITQGKLGTISAPTPDWDTQEAIAAFLDRETARIDALIEEQQRLIELLKEKRQAVISHAVTKGLDPTAPTKDSGVEWLGEVPAPWDVKPIKAVASVNDEVLAEATDAETQIEYVEISDVQAGAGIKGSTSYSFGEAPSRARRLVRDGDIVISTVRTYLRAIAQIENPPENMIVSTGFAVVRPKLCSSRFLGYAIQSEAVISKIIAHSTGISYPAINANELVKISLAIPPQVEQANIAKFLDRETARIDNLVTESKSGISLLQERRSALISAAVTGKIDVRGVVELPRNSEPEPA
jgi:type I restriction enzyme S subunit